MLANRADMDMGLTHGAGWLVGQTLGSTVLIFRWRHPLYSESLSMFIHMTARKALVLFPFHSGECEFQRAGSPPLRPHSKLRDSYVTTPELAEDSMAFFCTPAVVPGLAGGPGCV